MRQSASIFIVLLCCASITLSSYKPDIKRYLMWLWRVRAWYFGSYSSQFIVDIMMPEKKKKNKKKKKKTLNLKIKVSCNTATYDTQVIIVQNSKLSFTSIPPYAIILYYLQQQERKRRVMWFIYSNQHWAILCVRERGRDNYMHIYTRKLFTIHFLVKIYNKYDTSQ